MLDGELDIEQALASLSGPSANALQRTRLAVSAEAEIVRPPRSWALWPRP